MEEKMIKIISYNNKFNTNFNGINQKEKMYDLCIKKTIEEFDTTINFPKDLLNKINNL